MILAIDLGTTTCKTLLVDSSLRIIKKVAIEYPISTLQAGWAEQDPQEWWGLVKTSIATLTSDLDPGDIHAIGLSGQMHGLVLLDKKGKPLRPAILWNDQRSFPQCNQIYDLVGGVDGLLKHTNNPMLAGYTGGKIIWVLQNEPHIYEKIDRFCLPKDYIRYRLTGEISSDVSDASGTGLYDVRNRCWAANLLEKLKLPSSWFPVVHSSSDYVGEIGPILAGKLGLRTGTPVIAGGGDAVMQVVGGGGNNSLVVLLVIGTGGNVTVSLPQPIENPGGSLQIFCHVIPEKWVAMGVSLSAGSSLKWFRDRLGTTERALAPDLKVSAYELLTQQASTSLPGSNGLIFLPYLQGERAPYPDPNARASFLGLGLQHNKADMIRAIMEGVAYSLSDILDLILQTGIKPERIHVSGGGSKSDLWRQIIADVFERQVITLNFSEDASAIGAAIIAGVKSGLWSSIAEATAMIEIRTIDNPDPKSSHIYAQYLSIYKQLYPTLKPTFDKLTSLTL